MHATEIVEPVEAGGVELSGENIDGVCHHVAR
jgi:hypothetical protein